MSQGLFVQDCSYIFFLHFSLLVSMAPLSNEIRPVTSCCPPHIGPAVPEVNSVWFKLFIYDQVKSGPPSLLLVKGTRLTWLPKMFEVGKVKSAYETIEARAYPGFCCMKRLGVFLLPPGWDASPSQGYPHIDLTGTPLYTWVERGTRIARNAESSARTMRPPRLHRF